MMVEVPGGDHTITCTRLGLLDGSHIFLRTKWFNTNFSVTAMDFPRSWSCHVATHEVEDKSSMLGINCEEFFSQARLYLGDGISDSKYSFEALGQRPNFMRLSWTIPDMRYTKERRVTLFLQEDNNTMELISEFLNVLMDKTLTLKDRLARRKISKSKKVRQLAMQFSASKRVKKRSLSQQTPTEVEICGGLVVNSEFPNSTPKRNSSTVSYELASGSNSPMHLSSLTTLDGRVQQHVHVQSRLKARGQRGKAVQDDHDYVLDRVGSSQLQLPMKADVYDGLDRVPPPKHSPEVTARLYEDGLSSWAQPRSPIQTATVNIDRPAPTFHDVAVPKNVHNTTLAGDKAILSHESRKLSMANSDGSGWINPRKSKTGVESRNFEVFGSRRRGASQGQESIIMLSDSEEEKYDNLVVDPSIQDLLDPRISRAKEGLLDESENRFTIRVGHLSDSMPDAWRGNIEVQNMHVPMVKDEHTPSRLKFEAQTSLGCRSKSQKRKDRDNAHEDRTDVFDEGKRMQSKEQVLTSGGSLSRDKIGPDAQVFVRPGAVPCVKTESEYQSEQNTTWQSGDHHYKKHPSTSDYQNRAQWKPAYHTVDNGSEKVASSFNHKNKAQWSTWISEAKTGVTSWESPVQIGNLMTGGSGCVENQPTNNVVITSSPPCDSDHLVASLSLMKLDKKLDVLAVPHTDSEHLQPPKETPNVTLLKGEERECLEIPDRGCAENPESSHTRELDKSKKSVSSELEKVKVEREFIEGEKDGDNDNVKEPGIEPGLHNIDTEGMTTAGDSAADKLKCQQMEKLAPIRSQHGQKLPGRRGRPPGSKAQMHLNKAKSETQGTNTDKDGTTQLDKDQTNTNLQKVSRPLRPAGRTKHSYYPHGHPTVDADRKQQKVVPDSDCHNFDEDRVKEKMKPNEVWALYQGIDTMPRYLIRVKEVSTTSAFWVKASWLQPHIASKKNEQQKKALYRRGCGDFEELKGTTIFNVINCFSHRMEFTTKLDKVIQVYPQKDEVWALYSKRDSNLGRSEKGRQGFKQNEQNGDIFRLMVILSNCEEGRPVEIWALRKKVGYRTLWEPGYQKGALPIGSLERFSHRVPAYKLTAKDYPDLNKADIWDIDAAAVPESQGKVT